MEKRKVARTVLYVAGSLILAIVVGTMLMIAVYLLPVEPMRAHVRESIEMYEEEEDFPAWAPEYVYSIVDNATDSIIVGSAIYKGTGSPVYDAMTNPYVSYIIADDLTDSLVMDAKDNKSEFGPVLYARYWHGYLVWLKPALMLFSLSAIKTIHSFLQLALLIMVMLKMAERLGNKYAYAFLPTVCILNPITIGMCFQHLAVYEILLVAMLVLLKWYGPKNADRCFKVFLWIGIATAYFDFLTYPMVGLGIPLVLALALGGFTLKDSMIEIVKNTISWGIGYAGMWSSKWVVAYLLTGENTIADAMEAVNYRTSGEISGVRESGDWLGGAIYAIRGNLSALNNEPIWLIMAVILVSILILLLRKRYKIVVTQKIVPMLLIALFPFAWYIVLANHSGIHIYMAYRELAITSFAALSVVAECMVRTDNTKEKTNG